MSRAKTFGVLILVLSSLLFIVGGTLVERSTPMGLLDFKLLYYGARCFTHHCDRYDAAEMQSFFHADGGDRPTDPPQVRTVVTEYIYLPTSFLVTAPFARLHWTAAHVLWTALMTCCFVLACFLIWTTCAARAPVLSAFLIGFLLASSEVIFAGGNAVGLVVSLCTIAAWCFVQERFEWAGLACLAVALLLKPHDAGLVWLYFLIAPGTYRKRALQTMGIVVTLSLAALIWAAWATPHWLREQQANVIAISTRGGAIVPGPGSSVDRLEDGR